MNFKKSLFQTKTPAAPSVFFYGSEMSSKQICIRPTSPRRDLNSMPESGKTGTSRKSSKSGNPGDPGNPRNPRKTKKSKKSLFQTKTLAARSVFFYGSEMSPEHICIRPTSPRRDLNSMPEFRENRDIQEKQ